MAGSPKGTAEMGEKLGKVLYEAVQLHQSGREQEARLLLMNALAQLGDADSVLKVGLPGNASFAASPAELLAQMKAALNQEMSLDQLLAKFGDRLFDLCRKTKWQPERLKKGLIRCKTTCPDMLHRQRKQAIPLLLPELLTMIKLRCTWPHF